MINQNNIDSIFSEIAKKKFTKKTQKKAKKWFLVFFVAVVISALLLIILNVFFPKQFTILKIIALFLFLLIQVSIIFVFPVLVIKDMWKTIINPPSFIMEEVKGEIDSNELVFMQLMDKYNVNDLNFVADRVELGCVLRNDMDSAMLGGIYKIGFLPTAITVGFTLYQFYNLTADKNLGFLNSALVTVSACFLGFCLGALFIANAISESRRYVFLIRQVIAQKKSKKLC